MGLGDLSPSTGLISAIAVTAGNFFKSSLANMLVGRLTGSLQFTSWTGWGKVHNTDHHIHYGKDVSPSANMHSSQANCELLAFSEAFKYSLTEEQSLATVRY